MSTFLYRFGRWTTRHAGRVLVAWVAVLLATGGLAVAAGGQLHDDLTIPGTESQAGIDVLHRRFPLAAGVGAQVLFAAPPGHSIREYDGQVEDVLDAVRGVDHVALASDPLKPGSPVGVSADHRYALSQVQLDVDLDKLKPGTVHALSRAAHAAAAGSPLAVHVGGDVFTTTSVHPGVTEGLGVVLALLVLVLTFGSVVAAGMPVITAVTGVAVTMAGLLTAAALTDINGSTPTMALMIGLAVGIDYGLLIVSRHRAHLSRGMDVAESVSQAVATAGSAVIFAGSTVVIALCGLVVARIPFLTVMGCAGAAAVAMAVAVALTAVPALLTLAGERLRPRRGSRPARRAAPEEGRGLGARWVALATRAPALTVVLVAAGLLVMAVPAKDLALGLPDNGSKTPGSEPRVTYDLVTREFGPGFNNPLLVTTDIIRTRHPIAVMDSLGNDIAAMDGVRAVALTTPNRKADLGIVQVVPEAGQTSPATARLVREIRGHRAVLERRHGISDLRVTGQTAVTIDVSDRLSGALPPFAVLVVGLSLVLLTVVFRSIAVPVKATLGYLLSVGASFGAVAAVFEWGWLSDALNVARVGPVISFLPILLMGVLFGLAMDYEVFLVSRMREEYVRSGDAPRAISAGFTASARVVAAAAVIMISVFAAFVPHADANVKPVALGLAVGVFVDAFLVRMTLVPAVLALLGERAWWLPASLRRGLPSLDVEGSGLEQHLAHQQWVGRHGEAVVRAEDLTLRDRDGSVVFEHVDAVARPGSLLVVRSEDRVARRALLSCLAGRLDATSGTLVVLDRVLPDEAAVVRARVPLLEEFPGCDRFTTPRDTELVIVDDVDLLATRAEREARWRLLRETARSGVTVVAGCAHPTTPEEVTL